MDIASFGVAARLLLVLVFTAAGVTKLLDQEGARNAMRNFGLPSRYERAAAFLLPFAELTIAGLLLADATATVGALSALALLLVFIGGIVTNLALGRRPDCHCFGRLHSTPIGWGHVARNGALALLSALIFVGDRAGGGVELLGWARDLTGREKGLLALVVALTVALAFFARVALRLSTRIRSMDEDGGVSGRAPVARSSAPKVGAPAPAFALPALGGGITTLEDLLVDERRLLLLFTDPGCGPCNRLMPDIGRWQEEYGNDLKIVLISRGGAEANLSKAAAYGLNTVLIQDDDEVATAYDYAGTPGAVVVAADGTLASELVSGPHAIRSLVRRTVAGEAAPSTPPTAHQGDRVPDLRLSDLRGSETSLRDLREEFVLLFWDPACGFCRRMLPDLKAFESAEGSARIVLVSKGSAPDNRALGLSSLVLLDDGKAVGARFGARGTPTAVRIDALGRVGSEVAVGAVAVLELAARTASSTAASTMSRRRLLNRAGVAGAAAVGYVLTGWSSALAACRKGLTRCSGKCVNLRRSEKHCGKCGRKCLNSQHCSKGKCCAKGKTNCGGRCVNLRRSEKHCGACGHACAENEICVAGVCEQEPECVEVEQCSDGNPCTVDLCSAGVCMHDFVPAGTACGEDMVCDGAGACVQEAECTSAEQCSDGNPCTVELCSDGVCMHDSAPEGTVCGDNMVCDGAGSCVEQGECSFAGDCDDGNPCTDEVCSQGTCMNSFVPAGTPCGESSVCDDSGQCVPA